MLRLLPSGVVLCATLACATTHSRLGPGRYSVTSKPHQTEAAAMDDVHARATELCGAEGFGSHRLEGARTSQDGGTAVTATVICEETRLSKRVESQGATLGVAYDEYDRYKKRRVMGVRQMSLRVTGAILILDVEVLVEEAGVPVTAGDAVAVFRFSGRSQARCETVDMLLDDRPFAPPVRWLEGSMFARLTLAELRDVAEARRVEGRVCGAEWTLERTQLDQLRKLQGEVVALVERPGEAVTTLSAAPGVGSPYDYVNKATKQRVIGVRDMTFARAALGTVTMSIAVLVGDDTRAANARFTLSFQAQPPDARLADCNSLEVDVDGERVSFSGQGGSAGLEVELGWGQLGMLAQGDSRVASLCGVAITFDRAQLASLRTYRDAVAKVVQP